MKLFIYEHCPFCIRPRIIIGAKHLQNIKLIILENDDEKAHFDHITKKQVPFLQKNKKEYIIESLDICKYLNQFDNQPILKEEKEEDQNCLLRQLILKLAYSAKPLIHSRTIYHPQNFMDFPTNSAKSYFKNKKEQYVGGFKTNLRFPEPYMNHTEVILKKIQSIMTYKFATNDNLSWNDIYIFPILRSLTITQDIISIPQNIMYYLKRMSRLTKVSLYKKFDFSDYK